jgi:hypothetical protein
MNSPFDGLPMKLKHRMDVVSYKRHQILYKKSYYESQTKKNFEVLDEILSELNMLRVKDIFRRLKKMVYSYRIIDRTIHKVYIEDGQIVAYQEKPIVKLKFPNKATALWNLEVISRHVNNNSIITSDNVFPNIDEDVEL